MWKKGGWAISMNAAFFFHQWFHETIDDTGRKQRCEAHPVYPVIVQEAVDGIFLRVSPQMCPYCI